jgi:beta-glucosidase
MISVRLRALVALFGLLVVFWSRPASAASGPFPQDFLWGVANSGFQADGDFPDSNWTRYAKKMKQDPYGKSVDFYHRYPEDVQLARKMGVKVFRTSIEWARIEPVEGHRDEAAIRHYDDLIRQIRAAGMRPMLTLDHWVYPGWTADRGGWTSDATVEAWLNEVRFVVDRYRGQGIMWITFNEIKMYVGVEVIQRSVPFRDVQVTTDRLVRAHRRAYDLIHRLDPGAMVSTNVAHTPIMGPTADYALLDQISDKLDFIGADYYFGRSAFNWTVTNMLFGKPWDVRPQPDGIYWVIRNFHQYLPKLPIYIVENGMITNNGELRDTDYTRSDHLKDHLYWVGRAIAEGMPVIGYNYWSLTDDYQWGHYGLRLGLYTVNALTDPALTRTPTDTVETYRSIIAEHGVPADYVPAIKPAWCEAEAPAETCKDLTRLWHEPRRP